ncbi:MAG: hypothetical protein R3C44_13540 [Chloroflexota bacterium]
MLDTKAKQSATRKSRQSETKASAPTIDLRDPSLYINRELSHIEFNRRVLHETEADHPLLERVKFLAITTATWMNFSWCVMSDLRQQMRLGVTTTPRTGYCRASSWPIFIAR